MYQVNDDMSIYVTRGDIVNLAVTAEDNGEAYYFQPGDVVRIKVFAKKDCETVVLQKDFPVTSVTDTVELFLDENDTKIGEVISKPRDYWYEVELNPLTNPQTIIGYDEDGTKVFRLFPEGRDLTENDPVITPEDIPVVDEELSLNSKVTRALYRLEGDIKGMPKYVTPQMYGAIGDGVADDTKAFQAAVNSRKNVYIPSGSIIYIPSGNTVTLNNSTSIFGDGESSVLRVAGTIETDEDKAHSLELSGFRIECYKTSGTAFVIKKANDSNPCNSLSIHDMSFYNRNNISVALDNAIMSIKGIREATISNCVFRGDSSTYGKAIVFEADETHQTMNITITECNFYYIGTFIEMNNDAHNYIYLAGIRLVNNMFIGGTYGVKAAYVDTLWLTQSMLDFVKYPIYMDSCGAVNITDNYVQTKDEGQCVCLVNNSTTEKRFNVIARNFLWSTNKEKNVDGIVFDGKVSKISFSEICNNKGTALNRMVVMKNCQNNKVTNNVSHNSTTFFDGNNDSSIIEVKHNHADDTVKNFHLNAHPSCHLADGNRHGIKKFHKFGKNAIDCDGNTKEFYIEHNMPQRPVWVQASLQVSSGKQIYPNLTIGYDETHIIVSLDQTPENNTQIVITWEARASLA